MMLQQSVTCLKRALIQFDDDDLLNDMFHTKIVCTFYNNFFFSVSSTIFVGREISCFYVGNMMRL